ncbi:MAG: PAS domain-containing protein [Thiogranum sp.]|nr:PAS domain-containing protein [Thiogranum sp.]
MNSILIPLLYGLTGITAYTAMHHAIIAWRRPAERTHLLFALLCAIIAAYVVAKTISYQTDSAQELIDARRVEVSFAAIIFIILPWFVRAYTGQRALWLPAVLNLLLLTVMVANLRLPYGLSFTGFPEFSYLELPWGERVADLRVHQHGDWYQIGWLGMFLVFAYSLYASWRQLRRGERRQALALAGAIAVFMGFVLFNRLVNSGVVQFTHTAEFGFLALVFMMNQSLLHALHETERQMQAMLDNVPAVVYLKDLQGRYLLVNRQFRERFHIGDAAVTGKSDYDLFPAAQAETLRFNDSRVLQECRPAQFDESVDVDGETRHFLTIKFPVLTPEGMPQALGGASTDVTHARQLAREMDALREQVLHADRVARVSALSTSLAHELSQPLTAMLSNAQAGLRFMEQGGDALDECRDILQDIVRDDERAIAIIGGLRAMLRQKGAAREPIALADAVTEALDLMRDETLRRGVHCECRLDDDSKVFADKVQIEQVMLNLVMNALDALDGSPAGQRHLLVSVATDGDGQARVAVRDSGPGLPPNQHDRIFDSFYSTKSQGLGMGLALCRSIIESHGGRIWASDNADQGATVQFVLPIVAERQV